jgi:hypothetical protein
VVYLPNVLTTITPILRFYLTLAVAVKRAPHAEVLILVVALAFAHWALTRWCRYYLVTLALRALSHLAILKDTTLVVSDAKLPAHHRLKRDSTQAIDDITLELGKLLLEVSLEALVYHASGWARVEHVAVLT